MSDRYLYKAKRKHDSKFFKKGEWVEGAYYIEPYTDKRFIIQWNSTGLGFNEFIEVDEESVCQCTGLNDKNGNLIWENDVVKQFADCNELGNSLYFFYQIRWNNEYSAFEGYEIYTKETVLFPDLEDIEVIGNIFDNPELMHE